jgi:hypothetical protein
MLQQKIKSLAVPIPAKNNSTTAAKTSGKNFVMNANDKHIQNVALSYNNDVVHMALKTDTATYQFDFAAGAWQEATTNKPAPSLTGAGIEKREMLYPAKINGAYTWKDDNTLQLILRYIESPHTETFTCHFDGNKIAIDVERSYDYGKNKVVLTGQSN